LIVDDEPSQRELLRGFVESFGFSVDEASSAEEALDRIGRDPPQMVLLDVRMPGMSGIEALGEIRKIAGDLPVLLITAYADLRQAVEAVKSGADDYLAKPVDLGELEDEEEKKQQEEVAKDFEDLVKQVQETLGDKVKEVRVSHRLTNSPACLVTEEGEMSANLERILKSVGQDAPTIKPVMELNPDHPLVGKLKGEEGERFDDLTNILFDQALLAEGGTLDDPASFVAKLNKMLLEMSV